MSFKQLLEKRIQREAEIYAPLDSRYGTESALEQMAYERGSELLAELLDDCYTAIQRRMTSDDACGHPFDENLGELMNKLEEFLKENK